MIDIFYDKSPWASYSTLSTCPVSTASIYLTIEAEEECERIPLLAVQWSEGRRVGYDYQTKTKNSRNYGGINDQQCNNAQEALYFLLNNHDRRPSSSNQSSKSTSSYSSTYYYETKTHLCDVRLFAILFLLIIGLTIATYLLILETSLPTTGFTLDLVNHDIWSKMAIPLGGLLNHSNVLNVLLIHTESKNCDDPINCIEVLHQMQHLLPQTSNELPYNFLVGNDGQTYEVRGWDHSSGYSTIIPQNSSIVIGFIGNYTSAVPNTILLQSTQSLIKESIRRKKLQENYRLYGIRNITAHPDDAGALFQYITKWPHFENLINVF